MSKTQTDKPLRERARAAHEEEQKREEAAWLEQEGREAGLIAAWLAEHLGVRFEEPPTAVPVEVDGIKFWWDSTWKHPQVGVVTECPWCHEQEIKQRSLPSGDALAALGKLLAGQPYRRYHASECSGSAHAIHAEPDTPEWHIFTGVTKAIIEAAEKTDQEQ